MNKAAAFLEESAIRAQNDRLRLFDRYLDTVLHAANIVRGSPALLKETVSLADQMEEREKFLKELPALTLPEAPAGEDTFAYDMLPLLAMLPQLDREVERSRAYGIPEDVIEGSLKNPEECLRVFEERFGRPGMNMEYFGWSQGFLDARILRIGRLEFERGTIQGCTALFKNNSGAYRLMPVSGQFDRSGDPVRDGESAFTADFIDTNTYAQGYAVNRMGRVTRTRMQLCKPGWTLIARPGDDAINVHIPAGKGLNEEACETAYRRARDIFAACFPDFHPRSFVCWSWLMDPTLSKLLPKGAGIPRFQRSYLAAPTFPEGKAVFQYVFPKPFASYEELPEDTALQKKIKAIYLAGGMIRGMIGFRPFREE